ECLWLSGDDVGSDTAAANCARGVELRNRSATACHPVEADPLPIFKLPLRAFTAGLCSQQPADFLFHDDSKAITGTSCSQARTHPRVSWPRRFTGNADYAAADSWARIS